MPPAPIVPTTTPQPVSIIRLVSELIDEAYLLGASDIHLDPVPEGLRVRFRVDGLLSDRTRIASEFRTELISRIKVLAGLRTDEHFAAQDGRFRYTAAHDARYADIRVSVAPTYHGENAVLRILSDHAQGFTLESLGFDGYDQERIAGALEKPDGMILVTGPTGSGKTTTLYALLRMLHAPDVAIVTIEDPVEYAITGVRQVQTQSRTGLTFAHGLRAILRQDPDIIMVGEVRDEETARVAVNTALTGHLLLSTLHTNDASTALPRLYDLGVEPYLVASTLRFVIAQRLVRGLCTACKERGGCDACSGTGYRGRIVIAETLIVDDAIRAAILGRASEQEIRALAIRAGMRTMRDDGIEKARCGVTSHAEVMSTL